MMAARFSTEQEATIMPMKNPTRRWHRIGAFAFVLVPILAIAATLHAAAQSPGQPWPTKSITLVVPFPPGPALDLVARLVGNKLGETLGATVVVENRTGANGTLGSNAVARAAPDGAMLLITTASTHVTAVHLMKNLPYDPIKDFTPIAAAVEPVTCLVVNGALPVNSVEELFNETAGVKINHVPYRGVAPALQDVIAGHIPMAFLSISNALAVADAKSVKILAVLEPTRFSLRPDIPSMSEILPKFRKPTSWFGFFGPPGLPAPMVTRLNSEIVTALNAPDVLTKLSANGMAVLGGTPAEFKALIKDGIERYGAIIKAAGVQPE
jgi:tripartite-type tricarboxylate transporter receptor subunit TctC